MNALFINQVRKELGQNRALLVAWLLLLLWEFLESVSETESVFGQDGSYNLMTGNFSFYVLALLAFIVSLPLALGFGDSPSNSGGFIQTRPVSRWIVWGAKGFVLVTVVALPAGLVPFGVSIVHGAGIGHAVYSTFDRLAFVTPVLFFFLCWGGLSGSTAQLGGLTLAGTGIIVSALLLTFGYVAISDVDEYLLFDESGSLPARIALIFWFAAGIALLALVRQMTGQRRRFRALAVAAGTGIALAVILTQPRLNFLRSDPTLPQEVVASLDKLTVQPDLYSLKAWRESSIHAGEREQTLHLQTEFAIDGVPKGLVLYSQVPRATLEGSGDFEAGHDSSEHVRRRSGEIRTSEDTLRAIARLFDRDITVYEVQNSSDFSERQPRGMNWKVDAALEAHLDQPLDLECELALVCIGVKRVAKLPLADGATFNNDHSEVTLMLPPSPMGLGTPFALRTRMPQLWLTRATDRQIRNDWEMRFRYLCVLANPGRREALVCHADTAATTHGTMSGFPEKISIYRNMAGSSDLPFDREFFDGAELHVFQLSWLGEYRSTVSIEGLRLDHRIIQQQDSSNANLDYSEFLHALKRLGDVPEIPSEQDVRQVLRIIDSARSWQTDKGDPAYQRLVEIGIRNLDLLIESIGQGGMSQVALLDAIDAVAGENDKARIIAALLRKPALGNVIVSRGWEADAKDELLALLRSRRPLSFQVLQAVLLLGDPETHPFLLEQFSHNPQTYTYDILWEAPELRPELDRIVREQWKARQWRYVDGNTLSRPELQLALRLGDRDALEMALKALHGHDQYSAVTALRPVMLLPSRWDKVSETLGNISSDTFVFDPERRVFRQRPESVENRKEEKPL